jgi:hypothetical protein
MTNPFPFSSNAILTAAELNSIGEWTDYTPTTTWSSAGSFDFVRYAEINKVVLVKFRFDLTGTPTGTFQFSQPVVEVGGDSPSGATGTASLRDASAGIGYVGLNFMSGTVIRIADATSLSTVDATTPFTWASGDSIRGLMIYDAA